MIPFLVYSNLFISLAAGLLTLGSFNIFSNATNYTAYVILVFFATLFDYNIHRIIKLKFDIGVKEKNEWAKNHFHLILFIAIISLIISIISLYYIPSEIYGYLAVAGLFTFLYSIPFNHLKIGWLDIRKVPFMKNIMIAFAWTIITFIIPFRYSGETLSGEILIDIIQRFIFILALSIPFDISDIHEDRKQKFKTIPVLLGANKSWILANSLILIIMVSAFFRLSSFYSGVTILTGVITLLIFNKQFLRKTIYYNAFWIDGTILINGVLLLSVKLWA